jgi:hypothetical protein
MAMVMAPAMNSLKMQLLLLLVIIFYFIMVLILLQESDHKTIPWLRMNSPTNSGEGYYCLWKLTLIDIIWKHENELVSIHTNILPLNRWEHPLT